MSLQRELSDESVRYQAEQLLAYSQRGGGVSAWLDSKEFLPGDRAEILRVWARLDEGAA